MTPSRNPSAVDKQSCKGDSCDLKTFMLLQIMPFMLMCFTLPMHTALVATRASDPCATDVLHVTQVACPCQEVEQDGAHLASRSTGGKSDSSARTSGKGRASPGGSSRGRGSPGDTKADKVAAARARNARNQQLHRQRQRVSVLGGEVHPCMLTKRCSSQQCAHQLLRVGGLGYQWRAASLRLWAGLPRLRPVRACRPLCLGQHTQQQ